jgi:pimeloyl-ACP methyl ester carboxylesterase
VWTDVEELLAELQAGRLEAALELYDEELLAAIEDDWVSDRREELRRGVCEAVGRRAAEAEAAGDLRDAIRLTRRQIALDPLAEEPHRELIRRLATDGDRGAALAVYEKLAARLREELRTAPSRTTRELAEAVRSGDVAGDSVASGRPELPPDTKYAKCGDLNIAYQVVGEGPLDLVLVVGWISHLDFQWALPTFASFLKRLASFSRLIVFDKRGVGLSDSLSEPPTYDERMDDIRAVMDATGSKRAAIVGYSDGGVLAALFAAAHPERTEALILWDTFATPSLDPDDRPDSEAHLRMQRITIDAIEHWGEGRFLYAVAPTIADDPGVRRRFGAFERAALSPAMARRVWDAVKNVDIRPVLPTIHVPTLVIDFTESVIPGQRGRYLARHIPGARFVEVEGRDHLPVVGDITDVAVEIERFLADRPRQRERDRVLATILAVRTTHDAAPVRAELERFAPRDVEVVADGFRVMFDGPTRALECAAAVQGVSTEMKAGLHTGEVERHAGGATGTAVEIAGQIASVAAPGRVLVSRTVRDLVVGFRPRFAEPETHFLDGIGESWEVYAVADA